jgi:adenosylcobinamide kinase/adenosylcobinamide-phosphate guanylyltransferase
MACTFITGGASSGKSQYALELLRNRDDVTFVATGVKTDKEMELRIEEHRRQRPEAWETIEEALDLASAVESMNEHNSGLIIDCLTMWVSNLIYMGRCDHGEILERAGRLATHLKGLDKTVLVVSNELGMGIIPADGESREYRRVAGEVNQIFARSSDEVYFVISGIGLKLK